MTYWQRKLSDEAVRDIRASREKQALLAKRYGVDQAQISRIKKRLAYANVESTFSSGR